MAKVDHGINQHQYQSLVDAGLLTQADIEKINHSLPKLYIENGRIKTLISGVKTEQDICIIDYVNFTFKDATINRDSELVHDFLIALSERLHHIFGYGITSVRSHGANFYERSYVLGNDYGLACHGGQQNTVLISIKGVGCNQASDGWESRLFRFLDDVAIQPSITRLDIAHDDYTGTKFNCEYILEQYHKGGFTTYRKAPKISQIGNWQTPDELGRTINIGSRDSDKLLRCYEKGKQLKDANNPNWFRCEVEYHSRDTIISLDALLNPHQYFAGSYPAFNHLNDIHKRFETQQHEVKADIEHRIFHAKRQAGSVINLMSELGHDPFEIIEQLKKNKLPKKFVQKFLENPFPSIHESHALTSVDSNNQAQKDNYVI